MINFDKTQFLWCEKYRPRTIDDCVLPDELKNTFKEFVESGQIPHFLFSGTAGVGKTTLARALCNMIGAEYIIINGSDEGRKLDELRDSIKSFATTISLTDSKKVIILDEADYLNPQSVQPFLRNFMEEFSANCRFILTCNFKNRIIEPLHSRCTCIEFKIDNKDKPAVSASFYKRAITILENEDIEFDRKVIAELISKNFPDYRKTLNELQRYSVSGKIDTGILVGASDEVFNSLIKLLRGKDFTKTRLWVGSNTDIESSDLFRRLYDKALDFVEPQSIPSLVLVLGDYQHRAAFVADPEINVMCALTEIMSSCSFK